MTTTMKELKVIQEKSEMSQWSKAKRLQGKSIALVPTMGVLHEGHLSLVREASTHAEIVVVSIYVNPGQFDPSDPLAVYPSDLPGDIHKLSVLNLVDVVFCPLTLYDDVLPQEHEHKSTVKVASPTSLLEEGGLTTHETWIRVERLEKGLCGESRPAKFRGVATVVAKLFNIVMPDVALFGKKDYQQWRVISRMVRDLDFPIEIIGSETIRESDGLAMSSRNRGLSQEEREKATSIYKSLTIAKSVVLSKHCSSQEVKSLIDEIITSNGGKVIYVEIREPKTLLPMDEIIANPIVIFVAAWFGKVRLIDNMEINF